MPVSAAHPAMSGRGGHSHSIGDAAVLAVLVRVAEAGPERHLRAHDALAAVEVVCFVVHVHTAAHALCRTLYPPHQLCSTMHSLALDPFCGSDLSGRRAEMPVHALTAATLPLLRKISSVSAATRPSNQ